MIELRSDTFTRPTTGMLKAMMDAPVGDDVFGEDPSINALEAETAAWFGMEAGLFCPSGTMTNQIAIKVHTRPGDEVICEELSHVYQYEGGGIAFNSGCSVRLLGGNRGRLSASQVEAAINPDDVHKAASRLVVLENTSNRGGGSCYEMDDIAAIGEVARRHQLGFHLDGARLWNALVARGQNPKDYGRLFDSISVCFSKGMGTPVGSVLLGTHSFIKQARRVRKVLGGGMRQAGFLAAAARYALEHHVDRLASDHQHAQMAGEALAQQSWCAGIRPVETNIVIFDTLPTLPAANVVAALAQQGVLCLPVGPHSIRWVFHLDVSKSDTSRLLNIISTWKPDY